MAKINPTEEVGEGSGASARVHDYRHSQKPPLTGDVEHKLGVQIQQGNAALEALTEQVSECIFPFIQEPDLSPLSATDVVSEFRQSIRAQLVTFAGAKVGLGEVVQSFPGFIQDNLCDLLEEADPRGELDHEAWMGKRFSFAKLEPLLADSLANSTELWSELVTREVAINELAESHMPLARPLAMAAMKQKFELDDLLNEAFLILRRAAEGFDPHQGNRFASYAMTALRELRRKSPSRIGLKRDTANQLRVFSAAQQALSQQQKPSSALDVYEFLACKRRTRIQIENVRRILRTRRQSQANVELDLLDALQAADPKSPNPAADAAEREELVLLEAALDKLDSLEKAVVIGVCKLGKSFRGMAKEYHKSPATLSDLFANAMERLAKLIDSKWIRPKPR
ncbi:MAG: sigma-70 family RNA polymerase sigma factor [Pirellulaceae bacterium]